MNFNQLGHSRDPIVDFVCKPIAECWGNKLGIESIAQERRSQSCGGPPARTEDGVEILAFVRPLGSRIVGTAVGPRDENGR